MKNDVFDSMRETYQKQRAEYEAENDAWWNGLTEQEREDAFYAVVKRIHKAEVVEQGSYRYALYDVFGFDPGMYARGMECGYMDVHNYICLGIENENKPTPSNEDDGWYEGRASRNNMSSPGDKDYD